MPFIIKLFTQINVFKKSIATPHLKELFLTSKSLGFMSTEPLQKNALKNFVPNFENSHQPL